MLLLVLLLSVAPHTPSPLPHCASTLMTPSFGRSLGRAVIVRAAVRAAVRPCVHTAVRVSVQRSTCSQED